MIQAIKRYIREQQYAPGFVGLWLNPFYHARRGLYREIADMAPRLQGRLLDVGCGCKPYRRLFTASEYIGLELDTPDNRKSKRADYYYDGTTFPFDDHRFDGIICNQVLEHIFAPEHFLEEMRRVVRPGGKLLLTVPFVWDEHEQPWDFARYSSFGLKSLLERNGWTIIEHRKINADVRVLSQLVNAYLYKVLWTRSPAVNLAICALVMAPFNIFGALLCRVLPANADMYLDQLVLAGRVEK